MNISRLVEVLNAMESHGTELVNDDFEEFKFIIPHGYPNGGKIMSFSDMRKALDFANNF